MPRINYYSIMLGFGIWIAILPFFGFPSPLIKIFFVITGIFLFIFGLSARQEHKKLAENSDEVLIEETILKATLNQDNTIPEEETNTYNS